MANKILNTRICLKYDTYANWTSEAVEGKGANYVLKAGEVGICQTPAVTGVSDAKVMLKVGDGTNAFKDLPWLSAVADDVYAWAKASTKPSYSASEITGLQDFVETYSDIDTNTTYRIVAVTSNDVVTGYKLQKHDLTDGTDVWTDVSGSTIDIMTDAEAAAIADARIAAARGANNGIASLGADGKVPVSQLPDAVVGQMLFGGTVTTGAVATLTPNAKARLGTQSATITLTNDTTDITGYVDNNGIYYIADTTFTFASIEFKVGDWLISTGTGWSKIDNTDAVTGVKGSAESSYRIGNVEITPANIGVEAGAEVNIIETVKVNGVALTPDEDRAVDITIESFTLNPAKSNTLGGVKVGDGIYVGEDGKIDAYTSLEEDGALAVNKKVRYIAVRNDIVDGEDIDTALETLTYNEALYTSPTDFIPNVLSSLVLGITTMNGASSAQPIPVISALDNAALGTAVGVSGCSGYSIIAPLYGDVLSNPQFIYISELTDENKSLLQAFGISGITKAGFQTKYIDLCKLQETSANPINEFGYHYCTITTITQIADLKNFFKAYTSVDEAKLEAKGAIKKININNGIARTANSSNEINLGYLAGLDTVPVATSSVLGGIIVDSSSGATLDNGALRVTTSTIVQDANDVLIFDCGDSSN